MFPKFSPSRSATKVEGNAPKQAQDSCLKEDTSVAKSPCLSVPALPLVGQSSSKNPCKLM